MLFILYGGTLDMGFKSREYFQKYGFSVIKKYNYVANVSTMNPELYERPDGIYRDWFNDKIYSEPSVIEKLDFQYENNGILLGFDKVQIMNAIQGTEDAILTLSASSIDFICQLKKAYGDYVTVVCFQTSVPSYEASLRDQCCITDEEYEIRLQGHIHTQKVYLENLQVFDCNVFYEQPPSIYDLESLYRQFDHIIKKRKIMEHMLNDSRYVELPYTGKESYAFVSYSHENREIIEPILVMMQRHGVRVWYDDGIIGGENWKKIVSQKIENCSLFILFSSKEAIESSIVRAEIDCALDILNKDHLTIRLDHAEWELLLEAQLRKKQIIFYEKFSSDNKIIDAIPQRLISSRDNSY